jgi:hypothetical protein
MYPASRPAALLEQLETERAIAELTKLALDEWLPIARRAVLSSPAPDPTAVAERDGEWAFLVDEVILYGIGIIAAAAYDRAYLALHGEKLAPGGVFALRFPSLPSRDSLQRKVAGVLKRRLGINAEAVLNRTSTVPALAEFAAAHVSAARSRIVDAVGRAFRRAVATERESAADEAGEALREVFDPLDAEWQAAADEVGQTQATAALNAGTAAAVVASERAMAMEWVAILDARTRAAHSEADGQRQPFGALFDVGGEKLRFPGDPLGSIDNTINCRCRVFAFFTDEPTWNDPARGLTAAHVPATMADETKEKDRMGDYRSFESVLAVIGTETDDGRMFASDIDLTFRDFPLPLLWQKQSAGGHYNSFTVGVIESAGIVGTEVIGKGYLLNTPEADEAAVEIEHGVTGPSVDLGSVEWELRDKNGHKISEDDWWDNPDLVVVETVLAAKVLAATLVATPAFGQTSIKLGEYVDRGEEALVAAGAMSAPVVEPPVYSAAAFQDPGFTAPTLPHITEDGVIRGHLAAWNVCHTGIQDRCVLAPRSQTDYAWFHTSPPVWTAEGPVKVGRLTVGGGHAGPQLGAGPAIAHYDDVGTCFALVHVGEDEHGIWFSGVPAPGATPEQIQQGLAAPLSGDWRSVGGNLELVAALAVNTPGFPLVASGATDDMDRPLSLVASLGPCAEDPKVDGPRLDADAAAAIAVAAVEAYRAAERRDREAAALVAAESRRQALAIIEGVK